MRSLAPAPSTSKIEVAAHAERNRALRGLEVLRHIGIHVVLAVEHRALLDIAVGGKAGQAR